MRLLILFGLWGRFPSSDIPGALLSFDCVLFFACFVGFGFGVFFSAFFGFDFDFGAVWALAGTGATVSFSVGVRMTFLRGPTCGISVSGG